MSQRSTDEGWADLIKTVLPESMQLLCECARQRGYTKRGFGKLLNPKSGKPQHIVNSNATTNPPRHETVRKWCRALGFEDEMTVRVLLDKMTKTDIAAIQDVLRSAIPYVSNMGGTWLDDRSVLRKAHLQYIGALSLEDAPTWEQLRDHYRRLPERAQLEFEEMFEIGAADFGKNLATSVSNFLDSSIDAILAIKDPKCRDLIIGQLRYFLRRPLDKLDAATKAVDCKTNRRSDSAA